MSNSAFICAARRTPVGSFAGVFKNTTAIELGVAAVNALFESPGCKDLKEAVEELILGNVLSAGLGQAPARQVALGAGLPQTVAAVTVNKVCSSGLKAVMLGADSIALGNSQLLVAGGTESMSSAPFLSKSMRFGAKLGHSSFEDSILLDALWDVYNDFHMGEAGELCADTYALTRAAQDEYALESYRRATEAIKLGHFSGEIAEVAIFSGRGGSTSVSEDEEPGRLQKDKVSELRPVFRKEGTITAANASPLNDGAAALLLASATAVKEHRLEPLCRILSHASFGKAPEEFTTAPVGAINAALDKAKLDTNAVDLFEINEAFSCVSMACARDLELPMEKVNISGGAVALGHPIGASGAKILTTLCHNLRRTKQRYGVVGICNGGGEATAMVIERV